MDGEALATLVVNRLRGVFVNVAVKAPGFGDRRKAMLQDIAIVTGGQLIAQELGIGSRTSRRASRPRLARRRRSRTHDDHRRQGEKAAIEGRCQELRKQIADTTSDYDREKLEERLAKLAGGVAVIRVGAPSEAEMKSRHEAFDDAIHATRAAIAEGVVPGAGLALLRAMPAVETQRRELEGDERAGVQILRRALESPARQIAENSGVDGGVVVEKMRMRHGQLRLRCRHRQVRRPGRGRDHRSDQGRAPGARERGLGGRRAAADRGDDDRDAGPEARARGQCRGRVLAPGASPVPGDMTAMVS